MEYKSLLRSGLLGFTLLASLIAGACSTKTQEKEPVVKVQVVPVRRTTVEDRVSAEAILFPRNQAAIVPKISAPVRKFYVNRGSRVHAGQLLAVLENRDLAAAAQENRGAYEQAQANYETTTRASVPEEVQKAELDLKASKERVEAEQKVYDSRKILYEQGALPRKDFDQAAVSLTQARNENEIAQKHLQPLEPVGSQTKLRPLAPQLRAANGR